jgi:hypothetical protein
MRADRMSRLLHSLVWTHVLPRSGEHGCSPMTRCRCDFGPEEARPNWFSIERIVTIESAHAWALTGCGKIRDRAGVAGAKQAA